MELNVAGNTSKRMAKAKSAKSRRSAKASFATAMPEANGFDGLLEGLSLIF
jgi:hypothetical protein